MYRTLHDAYLLGRESIQALGLAGGDPGKEDVFQLVKKILEHLAISELDEDSECFIEFMPVEKDRTLIAARQFTIILSRAVCGVLGLWLCVCGFLLPKGFSINGPFRGAARHAAYRDGSRFGSR